jgi:hypothetical protein
MVWCLQDEFLRAMKASLRTSLSVASAALEHVTDTGAVGLQVLYNEWPGDNGSNCIFLTTLCPKPTLC